MVSRRKSISESYPSHGVPILMRMRRHARLLPLKHLIPNTQRLAVNYLGIT